MNRLPKEILTSIFFLLHQKDKVECMTVCHYWEAIISTSCLFHTVRISSYLGVSRLLEKINEDLRRIFKIERLLIDIKGNRTRHQSNLFDLLFALPNLKLFYILDGSSDLAFPEESNYLFRDTIEHISDLSPVNMIRSVLRRGVCPNLTSLDFNLDTMELNSIFTHLKNAPNLKTLNVYGGVINLTELETIHENAPSLTSLSANMVTVVYARTKLNVTPAPLITKLILARRSRIEYGIPEGLLSYIDEKYPNLKHLTFDVSMLQRQGRNDDLINLLKTVKPSLQSLSIKSHSEPGLKCRFLEDTSWISQLPELELSVPSSSLLDQSLFSNAIRVIRSLTLLKVTTDTFHGLKNFTSLTELNMLFSAVTRIDSTTGERVNVKKKIKFHTLLDSCPSSLKSLSLEGVEIESDLPDTKQYLIESLSFNKVDLPLNIDAYLSNHFPKLSTLKLKGPDLKGNRFVLPNVDLYRFQFGQFSLSDKDTVLVTTLKNNESRYYTLMTGNIFFRTYPAEVDEFDDPIYASVKSSLENATESMPCFTLVCHSVINVELDERYMNFFK